MKKSQNLLLLKVLFGIVHLLVFGFVLYMYLSSPFDLFGTTIILGLVVADALFMQYVIRKDEVVVLD